MVKGKRILDIASGSNTSKAPSFVYIDTPFGEKKIKIPWNGGFVNFHARRLAGKTTERATQNRPYRGPRPVPLWLAFHPRAPTYPPPG